MDHLQFQIRSMIRPAATAVLVAAFFLGISVAVNANAAGTVEEGTSEGSLVELPLVVPGPPPDIIFVFTGQVVGFVEPCGCPKNPAGGLPRRVGYLGLLEEEFPDSQVVLLETGEFASLFNPPGRLKNQAYLDALKDLDYDVVAIGERELGGGLEGFDQFLVKSGLNLTSASYTRRGSNDLLADPYVIKELKLKSGRPYKVGFISLSAYNSLLAVSGEGQTAIVSRDPVEQARHFIPELRRQVDFVVLLANLGPNDLRRIAKAVPGQIDLALGGFDDRLSPSGFESIGGIPTFYAGNEGRRLGEVRLHLEDGKVKDLKPYHVHLTQRYPVEKKYQKKIDKLLVEVNDLMRSVPPSVAAAMSTTAKARGKASQEMMLTAQSCIRCHEETFRIWERSRHARAMATLKNANQDYNPACVQCHSTGYGTANGFTSMRESPHLANVQCESCHGSAGVHLQDQGEPYGSVAPKVCYSCHTKENSPDFSFFKYWASIEH